MFCHFPNWLIKGWQPCIHDYMYMYFFQGRRVQTNKPNTITVTSGQHASCFASSHLYFFGCLFVSEQAENIWSLWRSVFYQNLMRKQAGEYIPGVFSKSFFHVILIAKCSANSFPIMLSICLVNWPQMPSFYKEKYIFLACNVSGKPWIWSHYLFNLLA